MVVEPWLEPDVLVAARRLLGWRLESGIGGATVVGEINEVEAYAGETDPASHAYRGETTRNGAMFGEPGSLYVYRSYGIHWCMNVVTGEAGIARAVLLRGARIVEGRPIAEERRGRTDHLADGPGKLTQALGVTDAENAHYLVQEPLRLLPPTRIVTDTETTPRIGISKAVEWPWRFVASEWDDPATD